MGLSLSLSLNICWEIELFDLKTLKLTVISLGSYGMRVEYDWVLRCGSGKQSELFAIWCCEMVFFRLFLFLDVGIWAWKTCNHRAFPTSPEIWDPPTWKVSAGWASASGSRLTKRLTLRLEDWNHVWWYSMISNDIWWYSMVSNDTDDIWLFDLKILQDWYVQQNCQVAQLWCCYLSLNNPKLDYLHIGKHGFRATSQSWEQHKYK